MKEIKIRMYGECEVYLFAKPTPDVTEDVVEDYDAIWELIDNELTEDDTLYEIAFMCSTDEFTWSESDGEEHPITKNGENINKKDYISSIVPPPPFVVQLSTRCDAEYEYIIRLNNDEKFDPLKLQLMISDYEIDLVSDSIIVDEIVYDGKIIETISENEFMEKPNDCYYYDDSLPYIE